MLLCPWNFPGKNTGVSCHFLLQRLFPIQRSNLQLLIGKRILYHWAMWEAYRTLSARKLMLLNCGAGEDSQSLLDCKEIKPVNPKGNQPWIFIRRNDAVAEAPILWSPDVESWLIAKDCNARKYWRQKEKCMAEMIVSLNQWTWIWTISGRQWRTEEPGVLQSMGSQRVRHDLANEQQTQCACLNLFFFLIQPQCNCSIPLPPLCKAAWLKENLSHLGHHEWSLML